MQLGNVKSQGEFYQQAFLARLRQNMEEAGYRTRSKGKSFELAHVSDALVSEFSRRTRLIEATAREKGIRDDARKSELGARTREGKQKDLTMPELRQHWGDRLSDDERKLLENAKASPRSRSWIQEHGPRAAEQAIEYAVRHAFERNSVVSAKALLAVALTHSQGKATLEQLQMQLSQEQFVSRKIEGVDYLTTKELLVEEQRLVDVARRGRGGCPPYVVHDRLDATNLSVAQKRAARAVLGSRDQIVTMRGAAGTGKTYLMQAVCQAIKAHTRKEVLATAPTISAAEELKQRGFENAQTVQRLLTNQAEHGRLAGRTIWLDEAGLVGIRTMGQLFALAEKHDARLILTGDEKQHTSVLRGSPLKLLKDAGIKPVELTEIRRQAGEYKRIVHKISRGEYSSAFAQLDRQGWVKEMETPAAHQEIAEEFRRTIVARDSSARRRPLAISPTHQEKEELTARIRRELFAARWLSGREHRVPCLESVELTAAQRSKAEHYRVGQVVCFYRNTPGFRPGERATVSRVDERGDVWLARPGKREFALSLEHSERFDVYRSVERQFAAGDPVRITRRGKTSCGRHTLRPGAEYEIKRFEKSGDLVLMNNWRVPHTFGHLDHAYVTTSHASQSRSAKRVIVAQSAMSFGATNAEQFYVSCSRGEDSLTLYTDDRETLREKIRTTELRKNAVDIEPAYFLPLLQRRERDEQKRRECDRTL